jgi:hypothetical protein
VQDKFGQLRTGQKAKNGYPNFLQWEVTAKTRMAFVELNWG